MEYRGPSQKLLTVVRRFAVAKNPQVSVMCPP
jgi:hypothetical protein